MSTFTTEIKLGNAAMQTPRDVAYALRKTADKIDDRGGLWSPHDTVPERIRDLNGNTVGHWKITELPEIDPQQEDQ